MDRKGTKEILISTENDNSFSHELANINGATLPEILDILKNKGKFTLFYYRVSFLAVTFQRFSPAVLIRNKSEFELYRKKYNTKSWLLGSWFLFFGPFYAWKEVRLNNKGGEDVTGDVLLNLTEEDLAQNKVIIRKMFNLFIKIKKNEIGYFTKELPIHGQKDPNIKAIYVGIFVNVEDGIEPPYSIGIDCTDFSHIDEVEINRIMHKHFRSFVPFYIFDLSANTEDSETAQRFKSQGQLIYERT
jgi:hypothetical protein